MLQTPNSNFQFVFRWWLLVFIFVMVLDFIYRVGSLISCMMWKDILIYGSYFISISVIIAFVVAIMSIFITSISDVVLQRRYSTMMNRLNALLGMELILFVCYILYYECSKRLSNILGYHFALLLSNPFIFLSVAILYTIITLIFFKKTTLLFNIISISNSSYKLTCPIAIISIFISLYGILNYYLPVKMVTGKNINPGLISTDSSKLPNIILITFDSLAAGHMQCYGYSRDTTPAIDALAREGYVFNNMFSSGNHTQPSLKAILTSKSPISNSKKKYENLPTILKSAGFETAVVIANNFGFPPKMMVQGFDKSYPLIATSNEWVLGIYDTYIVRFLSNFMHQRSLVQGSPEIAVTTTVDYLQKSRKPFFLWLHFWQPHLFYLPNNDFLYKFLDDNVYDNRAKQKTILYKIASSSLFYPPDLQPEIDKMAMRYDENIFYADHAFGHFLKKLKEQHIFDESILIVSSDHGEMFERGFFTHGGPLLYQPLIHVPLIVHLPGQKSGKRIEANISHIDIAPTILDLLGISQPEWMEGESFKKFLDGKTTSSRPKYSMNTDNRQYLTHPSDGSFAIIKDRYKLIQYFNTNIFELYDFKADPREEKNLVYIEKDIFLSLKYDMDNYLSKHRP